MSFNPAPNQSLVIDSTTCTVAEHPSAPGIPYGQEGRAAIVFQLMADDGTKQALKVFKPRFVTPSMMTLAESLEPYASLPGMMVCRRTILSPRKHNTLLRQYPDLTYAALMPWVEGSTWQEIVASRQEFTPAQSLDIARSFLEILLTLEERGLAHCDLSGSNFLLEMNSGSPHIALVDVEGMYAPGLPRPEAVPAGSPGYAHHTSSSGLWSPLADRFSGAILLAEMLTLTSKEIRQMIYGETFFAPEEIQQDCPRYFTLLDYLKNTWGEETAKLFAHAWHSETLSDCDSFGKWMVALPETPPALPETSHPITTLQQERQFTADEVYLLIGWVSDSLTGKTGSFFQQTGRKAPDGFKTNLERLLTLTPTERGDATKKFLAEFSTSPTPVMTFQAGTPAVPAPAPIVQNTNPQNQPSSMLIYLEPNIPMEFVRIPAGEFLMGSTAYDREADSNEKPQRRVLLDEFWMKKYPVTNEQYLVFVEKNFYRNPNHWKNGVIPTGKEKHPVVNVNFEDAIAFCSWVSSIVRRSVLLPSEAQWEKAARGIDGRTYPWGREIPDTRRCNFDNLVGATTLVGAFSPYGDSPYGCADMAGNVWEWVADWYDEKSYQMRPNPDYNPGGVPSGSMRVLRGGAWTSNFTTLRTTYRQAFSPEIKDGAIGFRCFCL